MIESRTFTLYVPSFFSVYRERRSDELCERMAERGGRWQHGLFMTRSR